MLGELTHTTAHTSVHQHTHTHLCACLHTTAHTCIHTCGSESCPRRGCRLKRDGKEPQCKRLIHPYVHAYTHTLTHTHATHATVAHSSAPHAYTHTHTHATHATVAYTSAPVQRVQAVAVRRGAVVPAADEHARAVREEAELSHSAVWRLRSPRILCGCECISGPPLTAVRPPTHDSCVCVCVCVCLRP